MSQHYRTAIVCGKPCEAPPGDYFVTCSFDPNHVLLRSRMPYHIIKCVKQHPGHNKLQCPYDATEYIDPDKFKSHLLTCESKRGISNEKFETAALKAAGKLCNIKQTPFFHAAAPVCDEDWGASDSESDDGELSTGVGRGTLFKREPELPKKGMGRAEFLNHLLRAYNEEKAANCSKEKDNVLNNAVPGQFDDN